MYFNHRYINHKYISRKKKRRSFSRIFVSIPEIKHTNNKATITLYVFNKEKLYLLKKYKNMKSFDYNKLIFYSSIIFKYN